MPASVSAFVRVDFNPGYGDKLTVNGLVKKFPTHGKSATDLVTKLETNIAKDAGLDYTTDVKPWFAGRAGVGLWTDGRGKPVALIALASTDDAKAEATLTKLRATKGADSFGFAMEKGYALIAGSDGDMQATAAAAVAAAKTATLADNATFKSAVAHVGDGNLLVGVRRPRQGIHAHQIGNHVGDRSVRRRIRRRPRLRFVGRQPTRRLRHARSGYGRRLVGVDRNRCRRWQGDR